MNPVPDAYLGVWQRRLLTTTAGERDETSEVFWLQTTRLYADLRIPQPPPAAGAVTVESCTHAEQQALAGQSGFAGLTEVEGERCQWHRLLDYQPARDQVDVGRMRFEHSERLIEDALDGSYREIWHRLPESLGNNWGLWLQAGSSARQGCLLVAGDYFLFAAERPCPLPPSGTLQERLAAVSPAERLQLLACELSFGRHRGGATPWRISLSTLPGRVGQALLPADCPHHDAEALPPAALLQLGRYNPAGGWIPVPVLPVPQETCP